MSFVSFSEKGRGIFFPGVCKIVAIPRPVLLPDVHPDAFLRPGLFIQLSMPQISLLFSLLQKMHPTVFLVKLLSLQSWTSHFLNKHMSFPISENQELVLFTPAPSSVPRTHALISGNTPIVIFVVLSYSVTQTMLTHSFLIFYAQVLTGCSGWPSVLWCGLKVMMVDGSMATCHVMACLLYVTF